MKEKVSLSKPLKRFLQVLFLLWFLTLLFGWIGKDILHLPGEDWYPLFLRQERFSDFTIFQERFRYFHEATFFQLPGFPFTYPAPIAVVFDGFFQFGTYSLSAFISFCFLVFMCACFALGRAMIHRGLGMAQMVAFIGSSMLLSYPFWFLVDRANIEIMNWLLVALGVTAYWHKRWYLAAAFFGVAISFKIFPFVFLGLLLSARKYWAVAWGIVICTFMTLVSTWFMGPTYQTASAGIANGLNFFRVHYMLQVHPSEIVFDHSVFAIVKELTIGPYVVSIGHGLYYLPWLYGYMAVCAVVGVILYFLRIRTLPRANQILALTVASILLPPVSADYTLVHLYISWGVLVLVSISLNDARKVKGLVLSFVCMAFLMAPESFAVIYGIRFAGQLKAIVLLILFIVSITYPFEEPAYDRDGVRPNTRAWKHFHWRPKMRIVGGISDTIARKLSHEIMRGVR
jgi:hypothetical protein